MPDMPTNHDQPSPSSPTLDQVIAKSTARISLDALIRSGKSEFRIVKRKDLMRELFDVVDSFVGHRVAAAERQLAETVQKRETEAREDGKHRVLTSIADLGDLVDSVVASLSDGSDGAGARALNKRLDRLFKSYGFERIATVGATFDPRLHELIEEEPSAEHSRGTIVRELARGYAHESLVLRVARVIISSGPQLNS